LFEGFTHKEIASELNISVGTSKSQYMRAKLKLKELIIEQYGE
jgi:DNA-directed RNA polymerase specialized sigma24 family protein